MQPGAVVSDSATCYPRAMLDRAQGAPLYHQAYLILSDAIRSGRYRPGALLPTEAEFAAEFGVSRITIRRALDELARANLIERQQGKGTFVRRGVVTAPVEVPLYSAIEQIARIGATTEVRVLAFGREVPPPEIRAAFGVPDGGTLQRAVRVRCQDGAPLMHLTTYVSDAIAATITHDDMAQNSLYSLIRRAGRQFSRGEQTISAELASPVISQRLNVKVGAPLLSVTRMMHDTEGEPIEHLHWLCSPERYQLRLSLRPDDFAEIEKRLAP